MSPLPILASLFFMLSVGKDVPLLTTEQENMMRKYLFTTAIICSTLGIASPAQGKIDSSPFAGVYGGVEAGYRHYSFDNAGEINTNALSYAGLLGFRFQLSPTIVLGVEGLVGGDNASKSVGVPLGGNLGVIEASVSSGVTWATSGLLGFSTEKNLLFVTLGYGKINLTVSALGTSISSSSGGVRAGLGLEHRLNKKLALRIDGHFLAMIRHR